MKQGWKHAVVGMTLVAMLLTLVGCGRSSQGQPAGDRPADTQPAGEKKRGGVLRIVDEPPGEAFGVPWEIIAFGSLPGIPVFEPLLQADWQGKLYPKLAERWEPDPKNKSVTVYLRQGVKFHDGTDFDAEAVRYNLQKRMEAGRFPTLDSVEVIEPHTVRLRFKEWTNATLASLGPGTWMVSPAAIEEKGIEWAREHPVGTGPFQFVSYKRDERVTYKRFEDYWDEGQPYLDGLELIFLSDPQTLKAAFLGGEIDGFGTGDTQLITDLVGMGYPYVEGMSGIGITVLIPSSTEAGSPLADKRVRLAISHAIDRETLASALGQGVMKPAYQLAAPGWSSYFEDYQGHAYDPQRAKQLLAEAGYPNGFRTKLIPAPFVDRDTTVAIQQYLAKVGIQTEIELPDIGRYREYQTKGWSGILLQPWGFLGNYNTFVGFYFITPPEGYVSVKRPEGLQQVWDQSRMTETEDPEWTQRMHQIILDDVTVIPVGMASRYYIFQKYVRDTNHLRWGAWPQWTPGEAWLDK